MDGTIIYRDYTQYELDEQYLPTSCIDNDIMHYVNEYQSLSTLAYRELECVEHAYGEALSERLDFFPCHRENSATHLFIHGGFWRMSDKSDVAFLARGFVERGINFSAMNYILAPLGSMADILTQARNAICWLLNRQKKLGITKKLTISGHSAGAHIALMLAATDWTKYGFDTQPINSVVGISGIYDLEPIRLSYVNRDLLLNSDDVAKYSPINNLPSSTCPISLIYGENETREFKRQSSMFSALLQTGHTDQACFEVPKRNHFDILFDMADPYTTLGQLCLTDL